MTGPKVFTMTVVTHDGEVFSVKWGNSQAENLSVFDFMKHVNAFVEENRVFVVQCNCKHPSMIPVDESEVAHVAFSEDGDPSSAIIIDWENTADMRAKGVQQKIERSGFVPKPHEMFETPKEK